MKGIRILLVLVIVTTLVFPGCKKYNIPDSFPDPDTMAEIIAELHVVDNAINYNNIPNSSGKSQAGYYRSILNKYGLTSEQFDTIKKWYIDNPEIYQEVYEKAIVLLSNREAEIRTAMEGEEQQAIIKQEELKKKLSELWAGDKKILINPKDKKDKRIPFRIATDSLNVEVALKLTAFYKFLREDESNSPRMMLSAFYADSTADTVYQDVPHSFHKKGAILNLKLKKNLKVTEVYGYLLLQDSLLAASVEVSDISLIADKDSLTKEPAKKELKKIDAPK